MKANDKQIGGTHYKHDGEQHWDRMWRLYGRGYFVGCATKYIERYHLKNGVQDLQKARHFIDKLIELEEVEANKAALEDVQKQMFAYAQEAGPAYVNQEPGIAPFLKTPPGFTSFDNAPPRWKEPRLHFRPDGGHLLGKDLPKLIVGDIVHVRCNDLEFRTFEVKP